LLAIKIEKELDIDADIWMRLQVQFDLDSARKQLKVA
jgi:plasmid maintenance system antidote protein VapI